VYNDSVNHPQIKKWLQEVVGKDGDDLSRHDKWLCMMYPRLKLLHRLLSIDGVIFISLDENENSHLRCIMNEIFGESNFVAQLTLLCNPKGRSQDKYFSANHEYITVFSKSSLPKDSFSITKDEALVSKEYKQLDEDGRYRLLELRNTHREFNSQNRPNLFYPFFVDPNTSKVSLEKNDKYTIEVFPLWPDKFEGCWTWGKELSIKDNHLLIAQKIRGNWKVFRKSYSSSADGENVKKKLFTIWQDSKFYTEKGQAVFGDIFPGLNKNDFPQPKSVDLIKEIFKTCTDNNDIILDSFSGSGTSGQALLNLNKEDNGSRKFILIEMMDYANTITAERVKRVIKGYGEDKKVVEGTGGDFNYYQLGEPLFLDEDILNEAVGIDNILRYIWYSETRTPFTNITNLEDESYRIGSKDQTDYYFYYQKNAVTTVDYDFMARIKHKSNQYIIYADNCLLEKDFMLKHRVIFKKIPRDIARF
jgi:adenine-specific DNA-methyltransferase